MNHAILEHKLIVPAHLVPLNALDAFKVTLKNQDEELVDYAFYDIDYQNNLYYFDRGDLGLVQQIFGHLQIEDRRSRPRMKCSNVVTEAGVGLTFTGKMRDNQVHVSDFLVNGFGYGQLKAHPRFGKTVVMTNVACRLGLKALFLSHQIDLAVQAYERFIQFTNVMDIEYELGKKVIGVVEKWEDLFELDVAFMPYQKFVSGKNADKWLAKLRNEFGLIFIDESHRGKALRYSQTISNFNAAYRYGVSGTTELKNDIHLLNNHIIGPVVVEGHGDQLPCTVVTYNTGVNVPLRPGKMFFTLMQNYLSSHEARNRFMLSVMLEYLKMGHTIITVSDRTGHCDWFTAEIKKAGFSAESYHAKKFGTGEKGKAAREDMLNRVRSGKTQAMIAMRSMVLGLDVPRATAFFNLMPTSNAPNYFQEFSRVRTPWTCEVTGFKKEMGYIIDFRDNHHILKACYKTRRKEYIRNEFTIHDDLSDEANDRGRK
jgi:superfamily II DNA or RNA helicase